MVFTCLSLVLTCLLSGPRSMGRGERRTESPTMHNSAQNDLFSCHFCSRAVEQLLNCLIVGIVCMTTEGAPSSRRSVSPYSGRYSPLSVAVVFVGSPKKGSTLLSSMFGVWPDQTRPGQAKPDLREETPKASKATETRPDTVRLGWRYPPPDVLRQFQSPNIWWTACHGCSASHPAYSISVCVAL